MDAPRADFELQLIREGASLRALARGLTGAPFVEDAVQESLRRALAARPAVAGHLSQWLRVTLKHVALGWRRGEARRTARERAVARRPDDDDHDPAAIAAEAELAREVAAAVQELEEPFRTVVVLRFWRGLLPEAIAVELGVPRNTVRSRLQRGLARLRERLDTKFGTRQAWCAPLLVFAGGREGVAAAAVTGGGLTWWTLEVLMQMKVMLGAAAVVLAIGAVICWPPGPLPVEGARQAARTEPAAPAAPTEPQPESPSRTAVEMQAASTGTVPVPPVRQEQTPPPALVTPWVAQLFVCDELDRPIADAEVTVWPLRRVADFVPPGRSEAVHGFSGREGSPACTVRTDPTGRVSVTLDRESYEVEARQDDVGRSDAVRLWSPRASSEPTRIELLRARFVHGRVLGLDGMPAAGAEVSTKGRASTQLAGVQAREVEAVRTDVDGRFQVPVQKWVGYEFTASLDGARSFTETLFVTGRQLPDVVLTFPGAITLSGLVVDAEGTPVPAADVSGWRECGPYDPERGYGDSETVTAKADAQGRFSIAVRRHARYQLIAAAKGKANSDLVGAETTAARAHAYARLVLPGFATIRGRVLREDGSPFEGSRVLARPETGWSPHGMFAAPGGPVPSHVDRFPRVLAATTGDDGTFSLTVHPGTTWTLSVRTVVDNWRMGIQQDGVAPGREDLVLTITDADLAGCVVSGTLLSADSSVGEFKVAIVDYDAEGTPQTAPSQLDARWDGNHFECPPLPLDRLFALRFEQTAGPSRSLLAPTFQGPFRTDRARIELSLRLESWGELPVRVVRADGAPARRVRVLVNAEAPTGGQRGAQPTDDEGRVMLSRCIAGPHRLFVSDDAGILHGQPITITPGVNPELVIRLPAK